MELPNFCVIDENIWILGLEECNRFNEKCYDAKNALTLFKNCKHNIKMIINNNYQQEIIKKLQIHFNQNKDSDSLARFRYIYPIITNYFDRYEWIEEFIIHSPNLKEFDQFKKDIICNIKIDDFFLIKFYYFKENCVLLSEDQEILELKYKFFNVIDSEEAYNRYKFDNCR